MTNFLKFLHRIHYYLAFITFNCDTSHSSVCLMPHQVTREGKMSFIYSLFTINKNYKLDSCFCEQIY